ncbi:LPS assembly lipoprotein LptE [Tropicimonas sp. IMCC6043]|uniref:LPS assembly lipoprotein LptE n=1 Tax=Tropicimonas sp. IMCC6043 TaxID=2510645 RepID=UPI00101D9A3A|nr:LPS assembly lipoprotein LptE [Tropicimonas sp. IMCC6043]RYH09091.1 hypothetical protein EU800_14030 [Tropicimonas sp. IMCC6043]
MWSSDRRTLLAGLSACLLATGCGFTPVYAPGGVGERLRGQVQAAAPWDPRGYYFVERFEERLGRAGDAAPYQLNHVTTIAVESLAVTPTNETYRYNLVGELEFSVVDRSTGAVLTSGTESNFTSYSAIGTTVATRASQKDAERRLMFILADQVATRLVATAGTWLP